jgi:hypothetical protein
MLTHKYGSQTSTTGNDGDASEAAEVNDARTNFARKSWLKTAFADMDTAEGSQRRLNN